MTINPNNPTGSFVNASEQETLAQLGRPVVSDEVFLDYPVDGSGTTFIRDDILTFVLGGLSKSAGLPQRHGGVVMNDCGLSSWNRFGVPRKISSSDRGALDVTEP